MKLRTVTFFAIALLLGFLAVEKMRLEWAAQQLQRHAPTATATGAAPGPPQGTPSVTDVPAFFGDSPVQTSTVAVPFQFKGFQVRPLADFALRARVLSRENYYLGDAAELAPWDLALGWRRMADPAVYGALNITQGGRWYRYSWPDAPPIALQEIIESSANMHMIASTPQVHRMLQRVSQGDMVRITGKLVDVSHANGMRWTSSLTRSDSGANACELVFVESVAIEP